MEITNPISGKKLCVGDVEHNEFCKLLKEACPKKYQKEVFYHLKFMVKHFLLLIYYIIYFILFLLKFIKHPALTIFLSSGVISAI